VKIAINLSEEAMNATTMKVFFGAVALAAAGCATEATAYGPGSEPQYNEQQAPAVPYPIPAADPKGTAWVMSFGAEPMPAPSGTPGFYLHLRIAAENRSDAAVWTIDTRDQVVNLGAATVKPTYAESSAGGSVLTLPQGQHGTLDVFYPVPAQGSPGQASLLWQVRRGSEPVTGTTPFEMVPNQSSDYVEYRPAGVAVDWWPWWWWGVGFSPWFWGPGWGYYPYSGRGHFHGGWGHAHPATGGWHAAPAPGRGFSGGFRGGGRGGHR
jgi:hypothetical protein